MLIMSQKRWGQRDESTRKVTTIIRVADVKAKKIAPIFPEDLKIVLYRILYLYTSRVYIDGCRCIYNIYLYSVGYMAAQYCYNILSACNLRCMCSYTSSSCNTCYDTHHMFAYCAWTLRYFVVSTKSEFG